MEVLGEDMKNEFAFGKQVDLPFDINTKRYEKKMLDNTNIQVQVPLFDSMSDDEFVSGNYGVPRDHREADYYCCICAGRHLERSCQSYIKPTFNQKSQQFDRVRKKLAEQESFNKGSNYYRGPQ
mmetsp:Transcript_38415/g.36779  ORF Transcript_38415/g.36779 Transcript_38415/m.36779 type:complete len:124 (-) Transcript_38415:437-808(-)